MFFFISGLNAIKQVQFCVERAIELTLNQLSDSGDDDIQLRDALRDMIEVLVDDQVGFPARRVMHLLPACVPLRSFFFVFSNCDSAVLTQFSCPSAPESDMKLAANGRRLKAQ